MRFILSGLMLTVVCGFAPAANAPRLRLADEKLPLQLLRPLDRQVYVLTLDGKWLHRSEQGVKHYVNYTFPSGSSYSHRVDNEELFRKGEIHCVLINHELARGGVWHGGKFKVVISAGKSVQSAESPEAISNVFEVTWPLDRAVSRYLPHTRHQGLRPVDAFPIPDENFPRPAQFLTPQIKPNPK